ncbi:hypothetical protein Cantr_08292 [Candida viswanathii]|uniref:F-box domain-containing protein n=1 Tax=Candida viswanathii TaxID=5486 RepID=A0A367Y4K1_9ASCO|nr:hypothetical protein Cantr_08292 [Candida viswanathii]
MGKTTNKKKHAQSKFEKVFVNLVQQPPEIIQRVLSYIRLDCLSIFLDCKPLVPFILPYIKKHVVVFSKHETVSGPLNWQRFEREGGDGIPLLMQELTAVMAKYDVCPKEATIHVAREVDYTYPRPIDPNADINSNVDAFVEFFEESKIKKRTAQWLASHGAVLRKIKHWNVLDKVIQQYSGWELELFKRYMNVKSLDFDLPEYDDEVDDAAREIIMREIPDDVIGLLFEMKESLKPFCFLRFSSLKKLMCPLDNGDQIELLPQTLESLNIYVSGADEEVTFAETHKAPANVKELEVSSGHDFPNLGLIIQQMPKLESFKLEGSSGHSSIESLRLPEKTLSKLHFSVCLLLTDWPTIRRFQNLTELYTVRGPFPHGVFVKKLEFPKLKVFEYLPNGMTFYNPRYGRNLPESENSSTNLNDVILPLNLVKFLIEGDITIDKWKAPPKLQQVSFIYTRFPNGINFELPPSVQLLQIANTNLESLNDFRFPSDLMFLEIVGNRYLSSMKRTNLSDLKNLFYVNFQGSNLRGWCDRPNSMLKYKFDSFQEPEQDPEARRGWAF